MGSIVGENKWHNEDNYRNFIFIPALFGLSLRNQQNQDAAKVSADQRSIIELQKQNAANEVNKDIGLKLLTESEAGTSNTGTYILIGGIAVVVIGLGIFIYMKLKKRK